MWTHFLHALRTLQSKFRCARCKNGNVPEWSLLHYLALWQRKALSILLSMRKSVWMTFERGNVVRITSINNLCAVSNMVRFDCHVAQGWVNQNGLSVQYICHFYTSMFIFLCTYCATPATPKNGYKSNPPKKDGSFTIMCASLSDCNYVSRMPPVHHGEKSASHNSTVNFG